MPNIPAGTQPIDLTPRAFALARLADRFLGTNLSTMRYGPGRPIEPTGPPEAREAGPRQFQYPIAVNTLVTTPRSEYPGLTPFEQLRNLATLYDVAALCIATRVEELKGLRWAVVARDKAAQAGEQGACDAATAFFQQPDRVNDFSAWLGMLLDDLFTIDALTVYPRPAQGGGLWGLEVVDGATIKPLLDARGQVAAYQQILYGMPWVDLERPGAADDDEFPTFAAQELLYRPFWTRSFTPYGFPPTEKIILRVNTALRKQAFDLAYFTDGNVPEMLVSPPDGLMNPEQVAQFEEWFNATIAGDDRARRRMKFLPWAATTRELRTFSYETVLDEFMLKLTCAAYGVMPQEIGFTNDVNRAQGELQENITYRRGLGPLTAWLKGLFDLWLQDPRYLGQRQLEWTWDFGETEDVVALAGVQQKDVELGVISATESRALRYPDLDGPAPGPPALPPGGAGTATPFTRAY